MTSSDYLKKYHGTRTIRAGATSADYLKKCREARSIEQLATHMRALGCVLAADLSQEGDAKMIVQAITHYERDAQDVERCANLKDAKQLARRRGYGC